MFAGGVFVLGRLSGLRLTFSTWGQIQPHFPVFILWLQDKTGSGPNLPVYSPPATTPLRTWLELPLLYLGKGLHETPGQNAGRGTYAPWEDQREYVQNITWVMGLLSHLARDLVTDRHDVAVGQLQHADHLTGHHVQGHLGHHGDSSGWSVCQTVAHWKRRENKGRAGLKVCQSEK